MKLYKISLAGNEIVSSGVDSVIHSMIFTSEAFCIIEAKFYSHNNDQMLSNVAYFNNGIRIDTAATVPPTNIIKNTSFSNDDVTSGNTIVAKIIYTQTTSELKFVLQNSGVFSSNIQCDWGLDITILKDL